MKKVILALAVVGAAVLFAFTTSNQSKMVVKSEAPDQWLFQEWDGGMDDPCYSTGNRCATILVGTEPGVHEGLSNAIANGGSELSDFLYSTEGLGIPFNEGTRAALASGELNFYPLTAQNGGIYYRYK